MYRVRTQDTKENCASPKHVLFWFNQTGPEGPQGPPGPQGPAGEGGVVYSKAVTSRLVPGGSIVTGLTPLSLPAGTYMFIALVRYEHFGDDEEGAVNCSIGVPGELVNTSTAANRVLVAAIGSFVVTGVITSASPFTAVLNCARTKVAIEAGTTLIALKLGSLVLQ